MPGTEFLTASRYYFEADGITDKAIKSVSGQGVDTPASDQIVGSTKQGKVLRQASPTVSSFQPITIEFYASNDKSLYDWYEKCNKNMNDANQWSSNRKTASITAYDQQGSPQAQWDLVNCYPTKYSFSSMTVGQDLLSETLELIHEGIKRVK